MKKIRIGNDVIVRVKLSQFNTDDKLKIKQLRCLFVQTNSDVKDNRKVKYYESSDYAYGCCGCPKYNYPICNYCTTSCPVMQECSSNKCEEPDETSKKFKDLYKDAYQADIKIFDDYIEAYMPANDQIVGQYNVIFIAAIYKQGWGTDNIKYATIEEGVLFEIVDQNGEGVTKNGVVDLTHEETPEQVVEYIIPTSSELFITTGIKYAIGDVDDQQNTYSFTFKDDQTDDVYELNEDNIKLFKFSVGKGDEYNITGLELSENGDFIVNAKDDGFFYIIISSKNNPDVNAKIKCNVSYYPIITEMNEYISYSSAQEGIYNLMDREINQGNRYEFKYKTLGSDVFEYITESTAKWFDFELRVDNCKEPKSSIDKFGKLTLVKEDISKFDPQHQDNTIIFARSKKHNNINSYIRISTAGIRDRYDDRLFDIIIKAHSPMVNSQSLHICSASDFDSSPTGYYITLSSAYGAYDLDKYDINKYIAVTLQVTGGFDENRSTIDDEGNVNINVLGITDKTEGKLIAQIKDRPSVSKYTQFSIHNS